jgi:hypothetical protein
MEFDLKRQGGKPFMPSRLYIYWNERAQLGTIGQDTGASIYLSTEVVREVGACHEADWPYVPARFADVLSLKPLRRPTACASRKHFPREPGSQCA